MTSPSPNPADRRQAGRITLACPALIEFPGLGRIQGRLVNLSTLGALVALPHELPLGSELTLTLALPDDPDPLVLRGMVVRHVRLDPAGNPAIGLSFLALTTLARRRIEGLVFAG